MYATSSVSLQFFVAILIVRHKNEWVASALANGAGLAHRWASQKSKAPPLPSTIEYQGVDTSDPIHFGLHYQQMWQEKWGRFQAQMERMLESIAQLKLLAMDEVTVYITAEDIMSASKAPQAQDCLGDGLVGASA